MTYNKDRFFSWVGCDHPHLEEARTEFFNALEEFTSLIDDVVHNTDYKFVGSSTGGSSKRSLHESKCGDHALVINIKYEYEDYDAKTQPFHLAINATEPGVKAKFTRTNAYKNVKIAYKNLIDKMDQQRVADKLAIA